MVKYHFITFATKSYKKYAEDLCNSAIKNGGFDTVQIYNFDDLDSVFKIKNQNILTQKRGAGYWLWKPYIIYKKILEIEDGDILCYCDSQYIFQKNIREITDIWLKDINIGIPNTKPSSGLELEKSYSKFDAFTIMNVPQGQIRDNFINSIQAWAGFTVYRKCFNSIRFISEWLTYAQDERIITDIESRFGPEDFFFKDNRHDQTILSILSKKWGIPFRKIEKTFLLNLRDL